MDSFIQITFLFFFILLVFNKGHPLEKLSSRLESKNNDIDGTNFVKKILNGETISRKPRHLLFTAPYRLCNGECKENSKNLIISFPLFIGNNAKKTYQDRYKKDHENIHLLQKNAPFKKKITRVPFTTCPNVIKLRNTKMTTKLTITIQDDLTIIDPITAIEPITTIEPIVTIEPITTIESITTMEPTTTIEPITTTEDFTTVDLLTAIKDFTTVENLTTIDPITAIEPITTTEDFTTVDLLSTIENLTTIDPMTTTDPTTLDTNNNFQHSIEYTQSKSTNEATIDSDIENTTEYTALESELDISVTSNIKTHLHCPLINPNDCVKRKKTARYSPNFYDYYDIIMSREHVI